MFTNIFFWFSEAFYIKVHKSFKCKPKKLGMNVRNFPTVPNFFLPKVFFSVQAKQQTWAMFFFFLQRTCKNLDFRCLFECRKLEERSLWTLQLESKKERLLLTFTKTCFVAAVPRQWNTEFTSERDWKTFQSVVKWVWKF